MSPDAGSSDAVSQNRGFVAIPEVGDQVMVGFTHGHPDRPFVMGGMFPGTVAAGGGINNAVKSRITRSGIKAVFNDDERSVHIEDPSGNTWDMDGQGNIAVFAPNTITLTAKNINMDAKENIIANANANLVCTSGSNLNLSAGNNFLASADREYIVSAQKATSKIDEDYILTAKNIEKTAEKVTMNSTKEDMQLTSVKKVNVQSSDKVNMF